MEKAQITAAYEDLIARFVKWAESDADIRFAVVIGSRARMDHPADEWSDLDIIFLVSDPQPYIESTTWLHKIGTPWITFLERTASGEGFERRVLFEGGLDVDFVPESFSGFMKMLDAGLPPDVLDMIRRGVRVLVDKEKLAESLDSFEGQPTVGEQPGDLIYLNVVSDFWYHTVWTAKHLCRGEIWWGKSCCDSYLKNLLLRMLEWHAQAQRGADTWMRGRFLENWADPRAVEALPGIFAHYDEEDIWRALLETMALFRWLARETADLIGVEYPGTEDARATALVQKLMETGSI